MKNAGIDREMESGDAAFNMVQMPLESVMSDSSCAPSQVEESTAPMFTSSLQHQTVQDGQRVVLAVNFLGHPSPSITWYQNGVEIKPNSEFEIYVDHIKGESCLVIIEIFPDDDREYACIAKNDISEAITTCRLTVIGMYLYCCEIFVRQAYDISVCFIYAVKLLA